MRKRRAPPRPRNPVAAAMHSARWRTRRARSLKAYSRKGRARLRPTAPDREPPPDGDAE